jgi:hypothetical protein
VQWCRAYGEGSQTLIPSSHPSIWLLIAERFFRHRPAFELFPSSSFFCYSTFWVSVTPQFVSLATFDATYFCYWNTARSFVAVSICNLPWSKRSSTRVINGSYILAECKAVLSVCGTRGYGDSILSSDVSDDLIRPSAYLSPRDEMILYETGSFLP